MKVLSLNAVIIETKLLPLLLHEIIIILKLLKNLIRVLFTITLLFISSSG